MQNPPEFLFPTGPSQGSVYSVDSPLIVFGDAASGRNDANVMLPANFLTDFLFGNSEPQTPKTTDDAFAKTESEKRQFVSFLLIAGIVVGGVIYSGFKG